MAQRAGYPPAEAFGAAASAEVGRPIAFAAREGATMPKRTELLELVRRGVSYEEIGRRFSIPPGQAYLIVTGLPADGSDVLGPEELDEREGVLPGSTQYLANPPTELPKHDREIDRWMKWRAHVDGPMQEAARQRTAEPPPIVGEDQTDDVLSVLGWDHNQVKYLEEQLETIPGVTIGGTRAQQERRQSIVDMITVRLSEHEVVEEEHFWPAVRAALPDGDALADEAIAQEQHGKDLLQELAHVGADDEHFDELVEQLVLALRTHVAFEDTVFLKLKEAMPLEDRCELGRRIEKAKAKAPTRPHPHAPNRPPANRLAAAAAGPLDHVRDAVGHRPAKRLGKPVDDGA